MVIIYWHKNNLYNKNLEKVKTQKQRAILLTGTLVKTVGCKREASPLVPFLILLDESIMVSAPEYPMGTPVKRHTLSTNNSKTWASGRNPIIISFSYIAVESQKPFNVAIRFFWSSITPLGVPVEPLVYIIIAKSSPFGGTASTIKSYI